MCGKKNRSRCRRLGLDTLDCGFDASSLSGRFLVQRALGLAGISSDNFSGRGLALQSVRKCNNVLGCERRHGVGEQHWDSVCVW